MVNLSVNARDAMPEGGRLGMESANIEVAGGASLGAEATSEYQRGKASPALVSSEAESILVVKDEEQVLLLAVRILQRAGHRVCACANGDRALVTLSHAELSVDLLLTSAVMPGMSGCILLE